MTQRKSAQTGAARPKQRKPFERTRDASSRGTEPHRFQGAGLAALVNGTLFALSVALFGGSSRYDLVQIVPLQVFACLCATAAALIDPKDAPARGLAPLRWFIAGLALIYLLQLIPLPPSMWRALPGRAGIGELDALAVDEVWRPLSLVPPRTINALTSLSVPIGALLVYSSLGKAAGRLTAACIVTIAALSSILGVLQMLGGADSALYFYSISSKGAAIGLFANPNHASVFNAVGLVVISTIVSEYSERYDKKISLIIFWFMYFLLLIVNIVNGSRAGLLCSAIALFGSFVLLQQQDNASTRKIGIGSAIAACIVLFTFLSADRIPAVQRLVQTDPLGDLRFALAPTLREMMWAYLPMGSGVGSFEQVYMIHERPELLRQEYINNAHNDWMQLIIEGGLLLASLYLASLLWVATRIFPMFKAGGGARSIAIAGLVIAVILGTASAFDYPTRTALFQVMMVWLGASFVVRSADLRNRVSPPAPLG